MLCMYALPKQMFIGFYIHGTKITQIRFFILYFNNISFVGITHIKNLYWKFLRFESIVDINVLLYIFFQFISVLFISRSHLLCCVNSGIVSFFIWNLYSSLFACSLFINLENNEGSCCRIISSVFNFVFHALE